MKKPSDFADNRPMGSVLNKSEYETIARNIMVILKRTGDQWRELSWEEYREERLKDGNFPKGERNFSEGERKFFEEARRFCVSQATAEAFSPAWRSGDDADSE